MFYMNNLNYIQLLKCMVPLLDANAKDQNWLRKSQAEGQIQESRHQRVRQYNRSEQRIATLFNTISERFLNNGYSDYEKFTFIYLMGKVNSRIDSRDLVENFCKHVILKDNGLKGYTPNQLSVVMWVLAKVDLKHREIITKISLELEQRLEILSKKDGEKLILEDVRYDKSTSKLEDEVDNGSAGVEKVLDDQLEKANSEMDEGARQAARISEPLNSMTASLLFWSYGKLNINDPDVLDLLGQELLANENIFRYADH
jgi:hypothetical protein